MLASAANLRDQVARGVAFRIGGDCVADSQGTGCVPLGDRLCGAVGPLAAAVGAECAQEGETAMANGSLKTEGLQSITNLLVK